MICEALLALNTMFSVDLPSSKTVATAADSPTGWKSQLVHVESIEGRKRAAAAEVPARVTRVAEYIPGSCAIQAKAFEQCAMPLPHEAADPATLVISENADVRADQLRRMVRLFNLSNAKIVRCERIRSYARTECAGAAPMTRAYAVGAAEMYRLQLWLGELMDQMNKIARPEDAPLALNCLLTPRDGVAVMKCYALDPARPHTRAITKADADSLPLTVGMSHNCTFTVLPDGRLLTADHCGGESLKTALVMRQNGSDAISAQLSRSIAASGGDLFLGRSFEDLAIWQSQAPITTGRPFYILTQDATRESGCTIVDDLYVVCAPSEFSSLDGRRANVLGFPTIRYHKRIELETVVHSRGDIIYDKDTDRVLIHASSAPGSSGGPTWLDRDAEIGGLKLKRPLYLGPVTHVNRSRPILSAFSTDTLVVVGVYRYDHIRAVMDPQP